MQIKKFLHNSIETLAFVKHWLLHLHAIPTIAKLYNKGNNEIFVVVNGPSLQGDIAGYESLIAQKDVLMVNQAIQTPLFKTLKPKYYAIVDTIFLSKSYRQAVKTHFDEESFDRVCVPFQKTFELFNTTEHNFTLFVPSTFMDGLKITNPRISTYTFGLYDFRGFEWLEKIAYKKALAMPSSDNILIFAIVSAIAMGYKRIYLLGCDQNAFLGYYVDNKTNKFSNISALKFVVYRLNCLASLLSSCSKILISSFPVNWIYFFNSSCHILFLSPIFHYSTRNSLKFQEKR